MGFLYSLFFGGSWAGDIRVVDGDEAHIITFGVLYVHEGGVYKGRHYILPVAGFERNYLIKGYRTKRICVL